MQLANICEVYVPRTQYFWGSTFQNKAQTPIKTMVIGVLGIQYQLLQDVTFWLPKWRSGFHAPRWFSVGSVVTTWRTWYLEVPWPPFFYFQGDSSFLLGVKKTCHFVNTSITSADVHISIYQLTDLSKPISGLSGTPSPGIWTNGHPKWCFVKGTNCSDSRWYNGTTLKRWLSL